MCDDATCADPGRRAVLKAGVAAWIGAATRVTHAQQTLTPPTRVLDDPGPVRGSSNFQMASETIASYLARPAGPGRWPIVIVVAGNFIAEEYIPNTCVALAKAGWVGLAPNIYHPIPPDVRPDEASAEMKMAFAGRAMDDLQIITAAVQSSQSLPFVDSGRVAVL